MIAPIETGKVSVSLQRLRYLERDSEECGELKRQLSEVKRERDSLKQQLNKANNIIRNLVAESQEPGGQCYECKAFDPGDCFKCYMGEADYYVCIYLKRGEGDTTQTATTTPVRGGEDS
jgi:predicted RNase H-like nuclease (RuvC/YqgF family)